MVTINLRNKTKLDDIVEVSHESNSNKVIEITNNICMKSDRDPDSVLKVLRFKQQIVEKFHLDQEEIKESSNCDDNEEDDCADNSNNLDFRFDLLAYSDDENIQDSNQESEQCDSCELRLSANQIDIRAPREPNTRKPLVQKLSRKPSFSRKLLGYQYVIKY